MRRVATFDFALAPVNKGQLLKMTFTVRAPVGDNLMLRAATDIANPE